MMAENKVEYVVASLVIGIVILIFGGLFLIISSTQEKQQEFLIQCNESLPEECIVGSQTSSTTNCFCAHKLTGEQFNFTPSLSKR